MTIEARAESMATGSKWPSNGSVYFYRLRVKVRNLLPPLPHKYRPSMYQNDAVNFYHPHLQAVSIIRLRGRVYLRGGGR